MHIPTFQPFCLKKYPGFDLLQAASSGMSKGARIASLVKFL